MKKIALFLMIGAMSVASSQAADIPNHDTSPPASPPRTPAPAINVPEQEPLTGKSERPDDDFVSEQAQKVQAGNIECEADPVMGTDEAANIVQKLRADGKLQGRQNDIHCQLNNADNVEEILTALSVSNTLITHLFLTAQDQDAPQVIPDNIGNLTSLNSLDITYPALTELPCSIGRLSNLVDITVHQSSLTALPHTLKDLSNLRNFFLRGSQIMQLPEGFEQLVNMRLFSLVSTRMEVFPHQVLALNNIDTLFIKANINTTPDDIKNMACLKYLSIFSQAEGANFPVLRDLTNLETLCASGISQVAGDRLQYLDVKGRTPQSIEIFAACPSNQRLFVQSTVPLRRISTRSPLSNTTAHIKLSEREGGGNKTTQTQEVQCTVGVTLFLLMDPLFIDQRTLKILIFEVDG